MFLAEGVKTQDTRHRTLRDYYALIIHAWVNLTRLQCDPIVERLKIAWPWDTPDCDPWNANQSIIMLLPCKFFPLCTIQASIQMKANSRIPDNLFPWLIGANILMGVPSPENLLMNDTYQQIRSPFLTCMSILPLWTPKVADRAFFFDKSKLAKCSCCVKALNITLRNRGLEKNPINSSKQWNGGNVRVENGIFFNYQGWPLIRSSSNQNLKFFLWWGFGMWLNISSET